MDQYNSLEEKMEQGSKVAAKLFSKVYECREEEGVWSIIQLLKLQRDKLILELAKTDLKEGNSLEIAKIQGKIEVIGMFLRDVQKDLNKRKNTAGSKILSDREEFMEEQPVVKKREFTKARRTRLTREAGILT